MRTLMLGIDGITRGLIFCILILEPLEYQLFQSERYFTIHCMPNILNSR